MTHIQVSKLPKDPGPAAWNKLLPDPPAAQVLERKMTADWVVIGAGFAGLAAARRLAQLRPSDHIVVLEAQRVAEGPAGRNSGFMIDLPHDLSSADYGGALNHDVVQTADNRHAIEFAAQMAADFGLGPDVFDRCGKINGAATAKGDQHNRRHAAHLAKMAEPYQMLDKAQMQEITGTDFYVSGLFTAGTAIIQPAAFVRGVAAGIASNRVQLFENSPVTALTRSVDWQVETPKGRVSTPRVILAVNGHLNSFGFKANRLMHVFTYASMTRNLTSEEVEALGGRDQWSITPADPMGTTVRRITTGAETRIVVRNRFTYDPSMEVTDARINAVARDHDKAFRARFPMLAKTEMQYRWGGRLCLSRNNVNVVGELETGLYSACCQNGLGTVRGTLSGMLAAELATDTPSERLDRAIAMPDPQKLPPSLIAKTGVNAFLKWQELKAGQEL
ncbi:NAD(P)/FAD-dependent oxidoreductase [Gymnodinialimonas sp.]